MKNFLSVLLVSTLSISSTFASVRSDVFSLGQLTRGHKEHSIEGKNAREIFENYLIDIDGDDEDRKLVFKEIGDMDYGDEVSEGFTSAKSAAQMGSFYESYLQEELDYSPNADAKTKAALKAKLKNIGAKWAPLIKKLESQGVKFGYTGNGPGYCGISFIELIIIDEVEQKLYEVYLSDGGEC